MIALGLSSFIIYDIASEYTLLFIIARLNWSSHSSFVDRSFLLKLEGPLSKERSLTLEVKEQEREVQYSSPRKPHKSDEF